MPWILSARSRTGAKVNRITGADNDSVTVYGEADLLRRLKAAVTDPRSLAVTVVETDDVDADSPRDPVELEERITAELLANESHVHDCVTGTGMCSRCDSGGAGRSSDPIGVFPGDASPELIRTAIDSARLFASHDGADDWERVRDTARWIAEAANWQLRDARMAAMRESTPAKHWLSECYDNTHGGTRPGRRPLGTGPQDQ